jgi:hypothetical protein
LNKTVSRLVGESLSELPGDTKATARAAKRGGSGRPEASTANAGAFPDLLRQPGETSKGGDASAFAGQDADARRPEPGSKAAALEAGAAHFVPGEAIAVDPKVEANAPHPVQVPVAPTVPDLDPLLATLGARVQLSPGEAQISLEAAGSGELSLYLRVRDGRTDVRVEGAAAHLVDARIPELKAALSQEGLSLGSFQSGGGTSHQGAGDTPERDGAPVFQPPGTPPAVTILSEAMKAATKHEATKRRVHVTA